MSGDTDDFNFYLQFTKPIVLNLPDAKDRAIAALWLKTLGDINEGNPENDLHVEYLKLLLFAAQKRKLFGIFEKPPPEGSLEPFPQKRTVLDMIHLVKSTKVKDTSLPPIHVSVSADLCEFVSIQEIPNFGIQGYYAISTEPLTKWTRPRTGEPVKHVPCYKDTCKLSKLSNYNGQDTSVNSPPMESTQRPDTDVPEISTNDWDISPLPRMHSKIEIPFLDSRPCWGTNRYIERLIDQSPHIAGDLDLSEADAILHLFRDRKMKPAKKGGPCLLPSKRRQVERMLDLPPCARDPGDTHSSSEESTDMRSCLPKCEDYLDIGCTDYCILDKEKQAVQSPMDPCLTKRTSSRLQRKAEYPKTPRRFSKQPKHTGERQIRDIMDEYKDSGTKLHKIKDDSDLYYSDWINDVPDTSVTQSFPFPSRTYADIDSVKYVLPESLDFEVSGRAQSKLHRPAPITPSSTPVRARPPSLAPRPPPPPPPLPPTPRPVYIAPRIRVRGTNLRGSEGVRYAELQTPRMEQPFILPPHVTVRSVPSEREVSDQSPYQQDIDEEFLAFTAFDRSREPEAQVSSLGRSLRDRTPAIEDEYTTSLDGRADAEAPLLSSEHIDYTENRRKTRERSINHSHFMDTSRENIPVDQSGFVSLHTASHERSGFAPEDSYLPRMSQEDRQRFFQRSLQRRPRPCTRSSQCSRSLSREEHLPDASGFVTLQTGYESEAEIAPGDSYYPENAERSQRCIPCSPQHPSALYEDNRASSLDRITDLHTNTSFYDRGNDSSVFWPTAHSTFIDN